VDMGGVPTSTVKHRRMSLYAEFDGASRLALLHDGDGGTTQFWRDGRGRVIQRQLTGYTGSSIAMWNTKDVLRRDALGRLVRADHFGDASGAVPMSDETFDQDSLGRVHKETFHSPFAPGHVLEVASKWSGANPFRAELDYRGNLLMESLHLEYGHDAAGRLGEVRWNKAPGGGGSVSLLASYGWAGATRRSIRTRAGRRSGRTTSTAAWQNSTTRSTLRPARRARQRGRCSSTSTTWPAT
jgi:hypothetical protein